MRYILPKRNRSFCHTLPNPSVSATIFCRNHSHIFQSQNNFPQMLEIQPFFLFFPSSQSIRHYQMSDDSFLSVEGGRWGLGWIWIEGEGGGQLNKNNFLSPSSSFSLNAKKIKKAWKRFLLLSAFVYNILRFKNLGAPFSPFHAFPFPFPWHT